MFILSYWKLLLLEIKSLRYILVTHTLVILYETQHNPNFSQYIIGAFLIQENLHVFALLK